MRINKWIKEYVIQEFTGYGRGGWEDSTSEETYKLAREQMKCYRKAGVTARLIVRRVINPAWQLENEGTCFIGDEERQL